MVTRRSALKLAAVGIVGAPPLAAVRAQSTPAATPETHAVPLARTGASGGDWPMFGWDPARTGGPGPGPSLDGPIVVGWRFMTGSLVESSPAVVDGVVYVGSYDGAVYALASPQPANRE